MWVNLPNNGKGLHRNFSLYSNYCIITFNPNVLEYKYIEKYYGLFDVYINIYYLNILIFIKCKCLFDELITKNEIVGLD